MFENFILMIITIIPITFFLKFTFDKDKIEKEPVSLLLKLFIAGVLSTAIVLVISQTSKSIININNNIYNSFIEIAFIEELCKWICIYIITWNNKEFDYKFDAIVYSIFVSLGFAFVENVGYSFNYGITASLLRAIISVPGHAFFAIYMGYYLGLAKMYYSKKRKKQGRINKLFSILIPTILHGIYNYCLISENSALYIIFILFIISLYILAFKTINNSSDVDMNFSNKLSS